MIIKRTVGPKGQVVIPKDVRDMLGISPGDEILIEIEGAGVKLYPARKKDDFLERFFDIPKKLEKRIDIEKQIDEEYD